MKNIACLMAEGFEELELITVVDILRRAELNVTIVGLKDSVTSSCRNVKITADKLFDEVDFNKIDGIYLPGGYKGAVNLKEDKRVIELIKKFDEEEKMIAAICAAPMVLDEAGVLELTPFTCYDGMQKDFSGEYEEDALNVQSGHILTSKGPATASIFAFDILNYLGYKEKSQEIYKDMLFPYLLDME